MGMLISEGKHKINVGNHPQRNMMSKNNHAKGKVRMKNRKCI